MSLAICAEELITDPSASPSSALILDAKLELNEVNEPLIMAAVKLLIKDAFVPSEPLILAAVKLLISVAFVPSDPLMLAAFAEPLIRVFAVEPNVEFHTPVP